MSASQALYGQASDGQSATNSGERSRGESSKKAKGREDKARGPMEPVDESPAERSEFGSGQTADHDRNGAGAPYRINSLA
jgi:hypothetical protein